MDLRENCLLKKDFMKLVICIGMCRVSITGISVTRSLLRTLIKLTLCHILPFKIQDLPSILLEEFE